jgi:predicted nucleic acid-binding protein
LFDTSADSYLSRSTQSAEQDWIRTYLSQFPMLVSVITVVERLRGYGLLSAGGERSRQQLFETEKAQYLRRIDNGALEVVPLTAESGVIGAELMAACPAPASPPRRTHRLAEHRSDRLCRWRFDILIAATALASGLTLVHNNPADFESLRAAIESHPERFLGVGPLNLTSVKRLLG